MKKVTGIGGIFFKSQNPEQLREWYKQHLGINSESWGTIFQWRDLDDPQKEGYTVWSPFKQETTYFDPSDKQFMINFRVDNLEQLLDALRQEGVTVMPNVEESEFGKFGWIIDNEGNKIELWEPPA